MSGSLTVTDALKPTLPGFSPEQHRLMSGLCRGALQQFVGRPIRRGMMEAAEVALRTAFKEAADAGCTPMPEGIEFDRLTLDQDNNMTVMFKASSTATAFASVDRASISELLRAPQSEPETKLANRYAAVMAELFQEEP